MDKKKEIIIVVVAVVVVLAAVGIYYWNGSSNSGQNGQQGYGNTQPGQTAETPSSTTAAALPSGPIEVPGQDASNTPANVAVPNNVAPISANSAGSFRAFTMTVSASGFSPSTVIVNQNDTLHISLTAQGGNFDFAQADYGVSTQIPNGSTKVIQFNAKMPGKFTFYCASCGGPSKGPVGYIEVVPKQ